MVPFEINSTVDTLYLTVKSGMLTVAKSAEVFYKAVEQSESTNDIRNSPGFSRVLLTSGRNEDKVFIIFRNIAPVYDRFSSLLHHTRPTNFKSFGNSWRGHTY